MTRNSGVNRPQIEPPAQPRPPKVQAVPKRPAGPDERRRALRGTRARVAGLALAAALAPAAQAQAAPATDIDRALQWANEAALAAAPGDTRVELVPGRLDPRLRLAPCSQVEPYLPPGARLWGRTRIGLRCIDGQARWNVFLPLTVRVVAPALVAAGPLPAGTTLAAEHLVRAEVDWAASPSPPLADASALVGRTLLRPLAPGEAPRSADLRARQWFEQGETVLVTVRGPGFAVTREALALADGIEGRPARARTEGGRVLVGRPVGERRIEVVQ